ncbi:unnamed protein product [Dovyalis caffra]|uniref:Uncharacterized protein n=1 Tax=Dovyalis caffra TaxID=77055 RepID=A0AAV1RJ75_9ROSI|nr:unnamed protein product [Dovyalis caffra]
MAAENTKVLKDLVEEEEEEEDVGLACPPFDVEDFTMAAEACYFDLSEEVFFLGIEEDHKSAERVQGSSGSLNAVQIKQKKHGKGKDMKVLEQFYGHKDNAWKDTNTKIKAENIESKKTLTKSAIDDEVSFQQKINLAKRKLHERYEHIAKEKKRKQIKVLSTSELPEVRREKCRPETYRRVYYKLQEEANNSKARLNQEMEGFLSYYQKEERQLLKLRCSSILGSHISVWLVGP